MIRDVILDTGPLVAFLHQPDRQHAWAKAILHEVEAPLRTCEAVISEACFLLGRWPAAVEQVGRLLRDDILELSSPAVEDSAKVFGLMKRYASVPMSFADACLVAMSERSEQARILTLDSDFEIYRRHGRKKIPLLAPWLET